jgi:heat shock protein HtpX
VHGYAIRVLIVACVASGAVLLAGFEWLGMGGLALTSALISAVGWLVYLGSERRLLAALRARPVAEVEKPSLYALVRELCQDARLPMPRLFISPAAQPNVLTIGCDSRSPALCCTEGLLRELSVPELRAVLAHELVHVSRHDTLASSWSAGLASLLVFVPLPATALLMAVTTPSAREYQADFDGALLAGDPMALASALRKISSSAALSPLPARGLLAAAGHLMIAHPSPLGRFRLGALGRLLRSHPPTMERVRRLESLAGGYRSVAG